MSTPIERQLLAKLAQKQSTQESDQGRHGVSIHVTPETETVPTAEGMAALMEAYRQVGADPNVPSVSPELADSKILELTVPEIVNQLKKLETVAGIDNNLSPLPLPQRIARASQIQELINQREKQEQVLASKNTFGGKIRRLLRYFEPQGWSPKDGFKYR